MPPAQPDCLVFIAHLQDGIQAATHSLKRQRSAYSTAVLHIKNPENYLNQIPAETPPEHIHAAVAACHTYGT